MDYGKRRFSLSLILVVALLLLLPVLAALQYSWVGQVSQSERERMQTNLRSGATKFSQDFDRELTRAFFSFQADLSGPPDKIWKDYQGRYDQWFVTAPFPRMVSGVFRAEADKSGDLHLAFFNEGIGLFEPTEWPAQFEGLRRRFEQVHRYIEQISMTRSRINQGLAITIPRNAQHEQKEGMKFNIMFGSSIEPLDGEIPALLIPVHALRYLSADKAIDSAPALSFIIVVLDLDYIKREVIPSLARRYFANGDALDYKLAIRSRRDPKKLIYRSDADLSEDALSSGDATASMCGLLFDEIESLSSGNAPHVAGEPGKQPIPANRFAISILRRSPGTDAIPSKLTDVQEGLWELILKHRAGSLEAVVASTRRRNLFISFGTLLLLAVSMTIIIVSTRRAERLARQQMEFVAGVSHELRTPLAVIRSAGENLADGVIEDRQQVKRYGALIADEGRRLTEIVEQVLEFSGIQSGLKTYELVPVEVSELIEDALSSCRTLIAEGGFDVEIDIQADLPAVAADPTAFNRALQNLLNNAMKYSGPSRWIKIGARIGEGQPASEVQITVEDRGLGIATDDLPHIFEPFRRGREALASQIHGNGLGLSLVRHIVAAHGGKVSVNSAPGRGSVFTLRLPVPAQTNGASIEPVEMVKSST